MKAYLFVHFREKTTPDGEQVYFSVSKDGFHWDEVNGGRPVLWSYYGDKGVRDHTIIRNTHSGKFYILATDLSLAYGMRNQYKSSWGEISRNGSKYLSMWESADLVNWTEQKRVKVAPDNFGCAWAPDIIYDKCTSEYLVHWSSSCMKDGYSDKRIFYSRTKDFEHFTDPLVLYEKEDSGVIDSAMYEENGVYYLFVKSERNPSRIILLKSKHINGPFEKVNAFDEEMEKLEEGQYEAPTAVRTEDGRWLLFLDYYGVKGNGQGYVPFVADNLHDGRFMRSDAAFSFPYGFKHGTVVDITLDEYERIKAFDFNLHDYSKY